MWRVVHGVKLTSFPSAGNYKPSARHSKAISELKSSAGRGRVKFKHDGLTRWAAILSVSNSRAVEATKSSNAGAIKLKGFL
jgi:hypothetical protein